MKITEITDNESKETGATSSGSFSASMTSFKPRRHCYANCLLSFIRRNLLLILLLMSLALGVGLGAALRKLDPPLDKREQMYFRFAGDLLMRMLKAIVIPLIVSSLISGVSGQSVYTYVFKPGLHHILSTHRIAVSYSDIFYSH